METKPDAANYDSVILHNEAKHLKYYSDVATSETPEENDSFINLSLVEIGQNISRTFADCLTEFLLIKEFDINAVINILTKEDRLIYIGIIILFVALCIFLV